MAEKKKIERKIVPAKEAAAKSTRKQDDDEPKAAPRKKGGASKGQSGSATGLRVLAFVFWLLAIAAEVLTILYLNGTLYIPGDQMTLLLIGLGIDLVMVVIGSLLWKKANHIDPPSKANKVKFFLQSQLGVIMAIIAFVPIVVILLKNKDLDKKMKKIVSIVAAAALLLAVGLSVDYDPASKEDLASAEAQVGDGTVYWTRWGKSYHLDSDCSTLQRSEVIYSGSIDEAFDAKREDPCDFCALEKVS
ncbi:MAG: hypothetical protein PHO41_02145 [Eubacteriales bacterium]|nr:hypothetical protein [Eubacteriales bacterium]